MTAPYVVAMTRVCSFGTCIGVVVRPYGVGSGGDEACQRGTSIRQPGLLIATRLQSQCSTRTSLAMMHI